VEKEMKKGVTTVMTGEDGMGKRKEEGQSSGHGRKFMKRGRRKSGTILSFHLHLRLPSGI
jgi:hypothetical protein